MRLSCLVLLAGVAGCASQMPSPRDYEATRDARAAALTARATPDSLATASVLLGFKRDSESLELINRAYALAPQRAEIVYLRWRACAARQCADEQQYIAALKSVDPGNGVAWLPELSAALEREDQREVTRILQIIGTSQGLNFYWNRTCVLMVDALTDIAPRDKAKPKLDLAARLVTSSGLLAALSIPPLQPLAKACRSNERDEPERRNACMAMASRLRQSNEVIFQRAGLSFQTHWSSNDSPETQSLMAQRRQSDYLLVASGRERLFHMNEDAATRLAAMRKSASEADVMQAMLVAFHEPIERPLNWKDPYDLSGRR